MSTFKLSTINSKCANCSNSKNRGEVVVGLGDIKLQRLLYENLYSPSLVDANYNKKGKKMLNMRQRNK